MQDNDNIELFKQQILLFRKWMFDRGYRNAPLYVTEYGVLMPDIYGFTMERVNAYMNKTFDFMLNTVDAVYGYPADGGRLVQRFSWYSTADKFRITGSDISGFNGYLYDPDAGYQSTAMGDNYAAYTARLAEVTDPIAVNLVADPATPLVSDGVATIQLTAKIGNAGNTLAKQTFNVRFYNGDPANGGTQIGATQTVRLSGCGSTGLATVKWMNVAPGNYTVYARVTPGAGSVDANPNNNSVSGNVLFVTHHLYLPLTER